MRVLERERFAILSTRAPLNPCLQNSVSAALRMASWVRPGLRLRVGSSKREIDLRRASSARNACNLFIHASTQSPVERSGVYSGPSTVIEAAVADYAEDVTSCFGRSLVFRSFRDNIVLWAERKLSDVLGPGF